MFVRNDSNNDEKYVSILEKSRDNYLQNLQEETKKINESNKIMDKIIASYSVQLLSKMYSVIVLLKNELPQYDSIYLVSRCFIENYAMLVNLMDDYGNIDFLKKLIVTDMNQGLKMLKAVDFNADGYYQQWKYYFDNILHERYDNENFENFIEDYIRNNRDKRIKIAELVLDSLNGNTLLRDDSGENRDSKFVYAYLCNISHSNISGIDERCRTDFGLIGLNENCINLEPLINTISLCMDDIVIKMKDTLK